MFYNLSIFTVKSGGCLACQILSSSESVKDAKRKFTTESLTESWQPLCVATIDISSVYCLAKEKHVKVHFALHRTARKVEKAIENTVSTPMLLTVHLYNVH